MASGATSLALGWRRCTSRTMAGPVLMMSRRRGNSSPSRAARPPDWCEISRGAIRVSSFGGASAHADGDRTRSPPRTRLDALEQPASDLILIVHLARRGLSHVPSTQTLATDAASVRVQRSRVFAGLTVFLYLLFAVASACLRRGFGRTRTWRLSYLSEGARANQTMTTTARGRSGAASAARSGGCGCQVHRNGPCARCAGTMCILLTTLWLQ